MAGWHGAVVALLAVLCVAHGPVLAGPPPKPGAAGTPAVVAAAAAAGVRTDAGDAGVMIHQRVQDLLVAGNYVQARNEADAALASGAVPDVAPAGSGLPCMHHLLGLALYYTRDLDGARLAFKVATQVDPSRAQSLVNYAECALYSHHMEEGVHALEQLVIVRELREYASKLCVWQGRLLPVYPHNGVHRRNVATGVMLQVQGTHLDGAVGGLRAAARREPPPDSGCCGRRATAHRVRGRLLRCAPLRAKEHERGLAAFHDAGHQAPPAPAGVTPAAAACWYVHAALRRAASVAVDHGVPMP